MVQALWHVPSGVGYEVCLLNCHAEIILQIVIINLFAWIMFYNTDDFESHEVWGKHLQEPIILSEDILYHCIFFIFSKCAFKVAHKGKWSHITMVNLYSSWYRVLSDHHTFAIANKLLKTSYCSYIAHNYDFQMRILWLKCLMLCDIHISNDYFGSLFK